jgi:hypothetical protein
MTRQPAAEKRFTVAWPMPRLAPVSSSVRRGWFDCGAVAISGCTLTHILLEHDLFRPSFASRSGLCESGKPVLSFGDHAHG